MFFRKLYRKIKYNSIYSLGASYHRNYLREIAEWDRLIAIKCNFPISGMQLILLRGLNELLHEEQSWLTQAPCSRKDRSSNTFDVEVCKTKQIT